MSGVVMIETTIETINSISILMFLTYHVDGTILHDSLAFFRILFMVEKRNHPQYHAASKGAIKTSWIIRAFGCT